MNTSTHKGAATPTESTAADSTIKETLAEYDIHEGWESSYRNPENEKFFELAFDTIAQLVGHRGSKFLDAGCGSCSHSMRLAKHGYQVQAIDYSPAVVETARKNVALAEMDDQIRVGQEDLLKLSFDDRSFDNVLCWGVLMHIPDVAGALSELDRVLRPGGKMIISEGNAYSLQASVLRPLRAMLGKRTNRQWTDSGFEVWQETDAGKLFVRRAKPSWLTSHLRERGYHIRRLMAGEFTELYSMTKNETLQKLIHSLNRFWFRRIGWARPAFGNILIAEKAST